MYEVLSFFKLASTLTCIDFALFPVYSAFCCTSASPCTKFDEYLTMGQSDVVQRHMAPDLGRNDKLISNPTFLSPFANELFRSLILAKTKRQGGAKAMQSRYTC